MFVLNWIAANQGTALLLTGGVIYFINYYLQSRQDTKINLPDTNLVVLPNNPDSMGTEVNYLVAYRLEPSSTRMAKMIDTMLHDCCTWETKARDAAFELLDKLKETIPETPELPPLPTITEIQLAKPGEEISAEQFNQVAQTVNALRGESST